MDWPEGRKEGKAMATLVKVDKNGSKHWEGIVACDRCAGQGGSEAWRDTGFTCWKCGGTGKMFAKWIERTPEYEAKLAARRAAKAAARAAEDEAAVEQRRLAHELEQQRIAAEKAPAEAQKAISQYVGQVGEKITIDACFEHTAWFDFRLGWSEERMYIHTFKDVNGNKLVWKTSSNSLPDCHKGEPYHITGTVKEHSTYKDEKQTVLTRCKIKAIKPEEI